MLLSKKPNGVFGNIFMEMSGNTMRKITKRQLRSVRMDKEIEVDVDFQVQRRISLHVCPLWYFLVLMMEIRM